MSDESIREQHEALAEAFGTTLDPLAELEQGFELSGVDPFRLFIEDVAKRRVNRQSSIDYYERTFRQFEEFMDQNYDRHPACPTTEMARQFYLYELEEKGNAVSTVRGKYHALNSAYKWFQETDSLPFPSDFNPFAEAEDKLNWESTEIEKELWPLTLGQVRAKIAENRNIKDRLIVGLGFKLGLRDGECRNIQLQDIHLSNPDVHDHYDELGTNPLLTAENAIVIPPSQARSGNKSKRPRVLPLDQELREALIQYMLIRPDAGEPWLLLTQQDHSHYDEKGAFNPVWRRVFEEYGKRARHKAVTSHYGRHFFSTHFYKRDSLDRIDVQYMRGDKIGRGYNSQAIDEYLHSNYEAIRLPYLDGIYQLGL